LSSYTKLDEDVDEACFDWHAGHVDKPEKSAKADDGVVDDGSSSQNAQFRAIQPLPEILDHIDSHVCPAFFHYASRLFFIVSLKF
jgi:hypothetical protein